MNNQTIVHLLAENAGDFCFCFLTWKKSEWSFYDVFARKKMACWTLSILSFFVNSLCPIVYTMFLPNMTYPISITIV